MGDAVPPELRRGGGPHPPRVGPPPPPARPACGRGAAPVPLPPLSDLPPRVILGAPPSLLSSGGVVPTPAPGGARRCRWPGLLAAWVAYVAILLPVLGIFQSGPQIAADRYTYLAGLGWATLAGAGVLWCRGATRLLLPGSAVCALVGLAVLTWNQVQVWHDSEKLWTHALAIDPNSSMAQNNFGTVLADQGKLTEAINHYQQALHINPNDYGAHNNWGRALAQQGKPAEAIEHYQQALHIKPDYASAHNNWGLALAQQGRLADAIEHYQQALHINPDHANAHNSWGLALAQQGRLAEAIEHYQQALKLRPSPEAQSNL